MVKPDDKKLFEAELEIEELAMQLADMLGVALYYAGVKKDNMQTAVDVYLNSMEDVFGDEVDDVEYGFEEIIKVIEYMKANRGDLFDRV
ncbi:MAG: hypothetical protein ACLFQJ_09610 [Campylobacterales bacterium]